jgi:predicted ATPase/DNA-binding winged helix-turn-helix (wHTH) protein
MPEQDPLPLYLAGDCEIDLVRRELRARGVPVPIGGRAFEIIEVLVSAGGNLVTKSDLMDRVWPGAIIGDNTLQVHISAVRKALGPYRAMLKTESGRGYRLVQNKTSQQPSAVAPPAGPEPLRESREPAATNFPVIVTRLIGRAATAQRLRDLVSAWRVVTLTGPGGIGKTTLALEVARGLLADFDGGWFVELASLSDPGLVPSAVASALGLKISSETISAETVARAIGGQHFLLVLDNCEHVIDAVANLTELVVRVCPRTTILATSREVLRIDGEYAFRVPPLDVPASGRIAPDEQLDHSAVQLFVTRMQALDTTFSPRGGDLLAIGAICRHLDGMPLAIEFAAARAATLGVQQVATGLGDRFALLTGGRRTALPRHRTLRATLDWSYDLLPETERRLLRHLAVFAGGFTLDGVAAVVGGTAVTDSELVETIANLVAKSLVMLDGSGSFSRWRMLETIRAYALGKLTADGELEAAACRHAKYHAALFGQARSDWESQPTSAWLAEYGYRLDDLRATLDWAFSSGGDPALGMALTVDAVPLWMVHSLMGECRRRVDQAMSYIEVETSENARLRMRLWTALSLSGMYAGGQQEDIHSAWSATLDLAVEVGDPDYQLRSIWGLFAGSFNRGDFRASLGFAERFTRVAADAAGRLIGERLVGTALHSLGEQALARRHIEHMMAGYTPPVTSTHMIRYQNDQMIAAHRVLAPILWLQGFPEQAMSMVEGAVTDALALGHALTLCNLLAQAACPVAFLCGDLGAAKRFTAILVDHATRHSLDVWNTYGRCFEGLLATREGNFDAGLNLLREAGNHMRQVGFLQYYTPWLGHFAEALGAVGQNAAGLAAIDEAIARAESTEELWCLAELLRIKGGLLLQDAAHAHAAEDCFYKAQKVARDQDVLSWELRVAASLCRMRMTQGRHAEARNFLAPVYSRFTEGFATADLRDARALLESF